MRALTPHRHGNKGKKRITAHLHTTRLFTTAKGSCSFEVSEFVLIEFDVVVVVGCILKLPLLSIQNADVCRR